jgi:hypothetical protein
MTESFRFSKFRPATKSFEFREKSERTNAPIFSIISDAFSNLVPISKNSKRKINSYESEQIVRSKNNVLKNVVNVASKTSKTHLRFYFPFLESFLFGPRVWLRRLIPRDHGELVDNRVVPIFENRNGTERKSRRNGTRKNNVQIAYGLDQNRTTVARRIVRLIWRFPLYDRSASRITREKRIEIRIPQDYNDSLRFGIVILCLAISVHFGFGC